MNLSSAAGTVFTSAPGHVSSTSSCPSRVFCDQVGVRADALDLSLEAALKPVARSDLEQLELDARAARIDHKDGFGVMAQARTGSFALRL